MIDSAATAPSERLRFGVLGLGKIARTRFLPALARLPSVRFTALGTRHPERVELGERFNPELVSVLSYEDLVRAGRSLVDAVYIALPNDMHEEWILRCAEAGLHVLCEKPLTATYAAALRCRGACAGRAVLLAEAFMYRHDPRHARVRELIDAGRIGRVCLVEATFSYLLEDLANIRLQRPHQGGALMDVGCYGVDVARLILRDEPCEVAARCVLGEASKVDELAAITLLFPSGIMALITASSRLSRLNTYRVRGSHGTVTVPSAFIPGERTRTRIEIEEGEERCRIEEFSEFAAFEAEIAHFARAVAAGDPGLLPPVEDGVDNAMVLEAAARSMEADQREEIYRERL